MNNKVLMIGNGINNLTNKESWSNLLFSMTEKCNVSGSIEINDHKPFPLLYEEIYLKSKNIDELELKKHISSEVKKIKENEIHSLIREKEFRNIITTNYEYVFQGTQIKETANEYQNKGVIKEAKYSIFRHNEINKTKIWHIHGECNVPSSITLGYEHYGGQLQQIRNYVVSGTHYKKKKNQKSLATRLKNNEVAYESWLDLFFKKDIHIIGLALDFVETDIWWLLTYRARFIKTKKTKISNKIYYYIPRKYLEDSKHKIELLRSINIELVVKENEGFKYYRNIIESIN